MRRFIVISAESGEDIPVMGLLRTIAMDKRLDELIDLLLAQDAAYPGDSDSPMEVDSVTWAKMVTLAWELKEDEQP